MVDSLFLLAPLGLVVLGVAYEAIGQRRDAARFPAPGKMFRVGNTLLHARTRGSGAPVIVLEAGAGAWSTHWDPLIGPLSELSTVLVYDRAGLGWSSLGDDVPSAENSATDLSELLRQVCPDAGEIILVAHAEGARIARAFAHRYPHKVAGVLFVDGYHESLDDALRAADVPAVDVSDAMLTGLLWASRLGLLRLFGHPALAAGLTATGLGRANLETIAGLSRCPRSLAGMRAERRAYGHSDQQLAANPGGQRVPTRTLVAGQSLPAEDLPEGFPRTEFNSIWAQSSGRLASIFSGETHAPEVLPEADHLLPLRHPQRVVACVQDLLNSATEKTGS